VLVLALRAAVPAFVRTHVGVHRLHALLHFSAALGAIPMLGAHLAILRGASLVLPTLVARIGKQRGGAQGSGGQGCGNQ
jgi:hypothetical protein